MAAADSRCNGLLPVCSAATTLLPLSTLTPEALVTPRRAPPATAGLAASTADPSYKALATSLPPAVELGAEDLRHRLWRARRDTTPVHEDRSVFHGRTLALAVTHADVWSVVKETRAVRRAAVDWYGWVLHRHSLEAHACDPALRRAMVFPADFVDRFPADCPEDIINHDAEARACWGTVGRMVPCGPNLLTDYDVMVWPVVAGNGADWSVVTARLSNDTKKEMDFEVRWYDPQGAFDPAVIAVVHNFLRLYVANKSVPPRLEGVNFATERVALDRATPRHASGVMAMWVMRSALFGEDSSMLPTESLVPRIAMHLARELVADCLIVEVDAMTQITQRPRPASAAAHKDAGEKDDDKENEDEKAKKKQAEDAWVEHVHDLARNNQGDELEEVLAETEDIPDRILHQKDEGALRFTLTYRDLATLTSACTNGVNESVARWYLWLRLASRSRNSSRVDSWMRTYIVDFSTVKGVPHLGTLDFDRYDTILFPFLDVKDGPLVISFIAILLNRAQGSSSADEGDDCDEDNVQVVYCHPEGHWDRARLLRAVRLFNEYRIAKGKKPTLFTVQQIMLPESDDASCRMKDVGLFSLRLLRTAVTCERDKRDINDFRRSLMLELVRNDSAVDPVSTESQTLAKMAEALQDDEFTMRATDRLDDDTEWETADDDDDDDDDAKPQEAPAEPVQAPVSTRRASNGDRPGACWGFKGKLKKRKKEEKKEETAQPQAAEPQKKAAEEPQQAPVAVPVQPAAPPAKTEPPQDESVNAPEVDEEEDKSKHDGKKRKHHKGRKSEGKHKHHHKEHKEHKSHHKHHHKKKEPEEQHDAEPEKKTEAAEPQEPKEPQEPQETAEAAAPAPVQEKPRITRCQCERTIERSPSVLTAVVVPAPAKPLVAQRVHLKKEPTATTTTTTTTTTENTEAAAVPQELGKFPHLDKAYAIKLEMFIEKVRCEDPDSVMATLGVTLGRIPQPCVLEARDLVTFGPETMLSVRAFTWYCCMLQDLADRCDGPVRMVIVHPDVVSQWRSTRKQRACNQLLGRTPLFKPHTDVLVPVHTSDAGWSLVVVQNGATPATTTRLCCYDPCGVQTPDDTKEVENMLQALRASFGAEPYHAALVQEHAPMPPACEPHDPHDNAVAVLFTIRALVLGESTAMPAELLRTFRMHAAYEVKKNTITKL